jgi:hypothetical protein
MLLQPFRHRANLLLASQQWVGVAKELYILVSTKITSLLPFKI